MVDIIDNKGKIGGIFIVLYPLIFPIKEYFIHRVFTLSSAILLRVII